MSLPQVHSHLKKILRHFHFLPWPQNHSNFEKKSMRISSCLCPKFNSSVQIYSNTISFSVLAENSFHFLENILRPFHFLSQPQIQCSSSKFIQRQKHFLSKPQFHSILEKNIPREFHPAFAANSVLAYKIYSKTISCSVLAANSFQFHQKIPREFHFCLGHNFIPIFKRNLREFHFLSQLQIQPNSTISF